MPELSYLLSPSDRAKLSMQVGIPLGDGRMMRGGRVLSATDAANAEATRARTAAFSQQTGQYADRSANVNPNQAGAQAYARYMQGAAPQAGQMGQVRQPSATAGQVAGPQPAADILNRARLMAQYQGQGVNAPQPAAPQPPPGIQMAVGPNISTAPTYLPYGSIGAQRASGEYTVDTGSGAPATFASEQAARQNYLFPASGAPTGQLIAPQTDIQPIPEAPGPGATAPTSAIQPAATRAQPVPGFLGGGYTPQQINAMAPEQRSALVAFNAEQAEARAPQEVKLQTARSQDAAGNPIEVSYDQFGREISRGPVRPTASTTINTGAGGETEAEKVVGKDEGEKFVGLADSAERAAEATANLDKVRQLYASGAYSGPGANVATRLKQIGATLGLVDAASAATQDELQAELAKGVLTSTKEFFKGMGALSNLEGAKAESAVANLSRTPEGNLRILEWQNANAPTIIEGNRLKEEARAAGKSISEANAIARKFMRANYKKLSSIPASPAASAQPAGTESAAAPSASPDIEAILNKYR